MNPLLQRFNAERKGFERIKKQTEVKVVRWEYWEWPQWHWEPDSFPENPPKRARKGDARFVYGRDKQNRVVVVYEAGVIDRAEPRDVHFLSYSGNKITGFRFMPEAVYSGNKVVGNDWAAGGYLVDVFEATLLEGRVVRIERAHSSWWDWKTFAWQGNKLATVLEGKRGRKPHQQVTYGKDGKILEELDLTKPPERKPLPKGITMQSLAKTIRERLAKTVLTTVTKAKIKEPVYCLALNYDCEGNPLLLPELGIGLDSERKARLKSRDRDTRRAIWEPEEFSLFAKDRTALQGRDRELDRACDLFNGEMEHEDSTEPARKLILQVAADLARVDWTGKLNTTDDFIVYAVDTYGNDLRKNLKISVPSKQLAKLKAAKLL